MPKESLAVQVARIEGKLDNGLSSRVRLIERMQWWQIGIMVAFFAFVLGAMVFLYQTGQSERAEVLRALTNHLQGTTQVVPSRANNG